MVHNTDKALTKTCEQLNCKALHYTVAPVYLSETSGKHQWLIEFEQKPKDLFQFAQKLDINIKELNSDYAAKRSNDITPSGATGYGVKLLNRLVHFKNTSGSLRRPPQTIKVAGLLC